MVTRVVSFLTDEQAVSGTYIHTFQTLDYSNLDYIAYLERLALLGEATQGSRAVYHSWH